jgi:hypothetical protein
MANKETFEMMTVAQLQALENAAAHDPTAAAELKRAKLEIANLMAQVEDQDSATPPRAQVLAGWLEMLDSTLAELRGTKGDAHDASHLLSDLLCERTLGTGAHTRHIGQEIVSLDPEEHVKLGQPGAQRSPS